MFFYYCFNLIFESFIQYILGVFFLLLQLLLDPTQPPYPSNFMFFFLKNRNKTHKKCGVHFVLVNYSWWWGLSWSGVNVPSVTPLEEKQIYPVFQRLPTEKSFLVRGGTLPLLSHPCAGLSLCWSSHSVRVSGNSYMPLPCGVWEPVSLKSSIIPGSYSLPTPRDGGDRSLRPEGKEWYRHPIQDWVLQDLALTAHCLVLDICINGHLCKKKLLWRGLSDALIYGDSNMSLGAVLLICSFSRKILVGFTIPLWPI